MKNNELFPQLELSICLVEVVMKHCGELLVWILLMVLAGYLGVACDNGGGDSPSLGSDSDSDSDSDVDGDTDSDTDSDGDTDADGDTDTDSDLDPGEPSFGSDATITDVHDMADIINQLRQDYSAHERYWGVPFGTGEFHTDVTWPLVMTWNDTAAAIAQIEADAVAGGASPSGVDVVDSGYFWVDGVNESPYMVTTDEHHMSTNNTFGRMSIDYHDFGGHGPVLTEIGVGASDGGDGSTVWVLVFME